MEKRSRPIKIRTCVGCGEKKSKDELVRIVYKSGQFLVDERKLLPGRGAYVCFNPSCVEKMKKNRRIYYTLKVDRKTSSIDGIYIALMEKLKTGERNE